MLHKIPRGVIDITEEKMSSAVMFVREMQV